MSDNVAFYCVFSVHFIFVFLCIIIFCADAASWHK